MTTDPVEPDPSRELDAARASAPPGGPGDDLRREVLEPLLGARALRTYPALLATQAEAMAWARADGPDGGVVVADYEAAPRGRGGLPWESQPGIGLGFSLLLRPDLPTEREGWLYLPAVTGLADVLAAEIARPLRWPDEVHGPAGRLAGLGVHAEPGEHGIDWAVITVRVEDVRPPRGRLLAELLRAIDRRLAQDPDDLRREVEARCTTLGQRVKARLVPMGPAGVEVVGRAAGCRNDGSLAIETGPGRTVAVPPQSLGVLEAADEDGDEDADPGAAEGAGEDHGAGSEDGVEQG